MAAIHRLYKYFKFKNIVAANFEKEHGLYNGYFSKLKNNSSQSNSGINEKAIFAIIENCHDLDLRWLITGKGEMIKEGFNSDLEKPEAIKVLEEVQSSIKDLYTKYNSLKNEVKVIASNN